MILTRRINTIFAFIFTLSTHSAFSDDWSAEDTAAVTCSVMGETRNMDAAIRVEKINEARQSLGLRPYVSGDFFITEALKNGRCQQLVLDEAGFFAWFNDEQNKLRDAREQEQKLKEREVAEEARKLKQRRANETLRLEKEYGFVCPKTEKEKSAMVKKSWDEGNAGLYAFILKCPQTW